MLIELIEINSIYDFISLFCLLINIYFIFSFDIILIIGLILCICIQFMIKYITTEGKYRSGGVLISNKAPEYFILKNPRNEITWSVKLDNCSIFSGVAPK